MMNIQRVPAEAVIDLRWEILRSEFPRSTAIFPADDLPETRHFAAYQQGEIVAIATICLQPFPDRPGELWYQLRGMASRPEVRGKGFARALLQSCEEAASTAGAAGIWCNARIAAVGFYQKNGWQVIGEEFQIATVGPHFRMWRQLAGH